MAIAYYGICPAACRGGSARMRGLSLCGTAEVAGSGRITRYSEDSIATAGHCELDSRRYAHEPLLALAKCPISCASVRRTITWAR